MRVRDETARILDGTSLADLLPFLAAWHNGGELTTGIAWAICAFGPREIECSLGAAALGGHVRIGFENNLLLPDGRTARDNAELIGCFAELAGRLGHSLADADQLRGLFA